MFSFGYFPGVWGLKTDVSEPSIGSIFLGRWRKNKWQSRQQLICFTERLRVFFSTFNAGLFEMIVGVLTTCHLVLQMQPHVISFYGVTSRIRFMFLLFPQVSRNWRCESKPPLKASPLTCCKQFGTNSIIMMMFVESQRVPHIEHL